MNFRLKAMKLWQLSLLFVCINNIDARTLLTRNEQLDNQDRSVPFGVTDKPAKYFDDPALKNVQLAMQDIKWAAEDMNAMEIKLYELEKEKKTVFNAEKDLRTATNSDGYEYGIKRN